MRARKTAKRIIIAAAYAEHDVADSAVAVQRQIIEQSPPSSRRTKKSRHQDGTIDAPGPSHCNSGTLAITAEIRENPADRPREQRGKV